MRRTTAIAAALCTVLGAAAAAQDQAEDEADQIFHGFAVEPWSGSAFYSQANDGFSHCLMASQFDRQMSLVVALDLAGGVSLGVRNPRWSLAVLEEQPMAFTLGGAQRHEEAATAVDATLLLVRFDDGESILGELSRASVVTVEQGNQNFQFVMVNASQGVAALRDCTITARLDLVTGGDPARAVSEPTVPDDPDTAASSQQRTILVDPLTLDQTVARNFLLAAGLTDFTLMTPDELTDFLTDARAAWTDGGVYGALYTIAPRQRRLDRAADQLLEVLTEGCDGDFTTSPIVTADDDDTIVRRAGACDEALLGMLFRATAINGEAGTLIILHAALREEADRLALADDRLIQAIREGRIAVE